MLDIRIMAIELAFHGAAGVVTGSCMELVVSGRRILIDCGLFQGSRSLEALNIEALPFDVGKIDAVLVTHAHLDHTGRLPLLARNGSRAEIWCTPPTSRLIEPILMDAAKLQAADAERRNERPDRAGLEPFQPLYEFADVTRLVERIRSVAYGKWAEPVPGLRIRFHDARHILGAASIEVQAEGQSLLFSGDLGTDAASAGPVAPEGGGWDHIVCEATYGNRDRVILGDDARREQLAQAVEQALARGGNLLVPVFALERTQVILEDLVTLFESGRLHGSQVFVDSPLADRVTRAYRQFARPKKGPSPFDHPKIRFTANIDESKALNRVSGAIILAGSGMCTGGRIRYHLLRNLPRADSTLLFVGYQARGTLGAVLKDGARAVRISGSDVRVRANIATLDGYSAHADHKGLLAWLNQRAPVTGSVFLDHGEQPALQQLAADAAEIQGIPHPIIAALGERFRLESGKPASRICGARPAVETLTATGDWRNRYAAFRASLDDTLQALPDDAARIWALAAAEQALHAG